MSSDLSVSLLGVRMAKPWMNASGVLADVFVLKEWSKYLGAVVTKSAGYRPRQGYETPNICAPSDDSLLNAMGLPNPGYAEICAELDEASIGVPVVGSFYGDTAEQAGEIAYAMSGHCSILEQNVSCPNIRPGEKTGIAVGTDPKLIYEHVKAAKDVTAKSGATKPLIVKMSPALYIGDQGRFYETLAAAKDAGADGFCAINTVPGGMAIDVRTGRPMLSAGRGGVSGSGIKPLGIGCVSYIREKFPGMPIVGVGGISDASDVIEYMEAGATAVQIGTEFKGMGLKDAKAFFGRMEQRLDAFMGEIGIESVSELTGWREQ